MVSGWKAIEQYLKEVEREAKLGLDQQVPQMFNEMTNTTNNEHCNLSQTDFFNENIFIRPSPVPVSESVQVPFHNDISDIYDLDREFIHPIESVEESFYQNEDSDYGSKLQRVDKIYQCKSVGDEYIKQESYDLDYQHLPNENMDAFRNMQSKILGECVQDVHDTCKCLDICSDPIQWSCAEVQQWITWQCHQFNLPQLSMEKFNISGAQLCNLSEEHFRMYAREAGSTLYSRLYIWRCVVEQTTDNGSANNAIQLMQIPIPTSPSLPPSTGSASPSPSVYSEDSQPSFQLKQFEQTIGRTAATEDEDRLPEEPINHKQTIQLWQFLKLLLQDGNYNDCIRWVDRARGIFKIENSTRVAKLWGKRKNRPAMNYDKLSRSIRQYYKKNIIKKTEHSKRLVYQFCHL